MKANLSILGVKDGDANIITLQKEDKNLVILIDSGEAEYANYVISKLDTVLAIENKAAPDLIVCTHYDSDHISGMLEIIKHYVKKKATIGEVWLHRPTNEFKSLVKESIDYKSDMLEVVPTYNRFVIESYFTGQNQLKEAKLIIESLNQLDELVTYIDSKHIPIKEPFAGDKYSPDWLEIEVFGPSVVYFNHLFPRGIILKDLITEEIELSSSCKIKSANGILISDCEILDSNSHKKKVTKTNGASIIININVNGDNLLFTGDADIKSFKAIENYQEKLSNLYFLKIPHHASRNNLSTELINIMRPKYAAVSGDKYIDDEVVGCLRAHGSKVSILDNSESDYSISIGE